MPNPVPTDIMVRPRVPEAPLRFISPSDLLQASTALFQSFNSDKMSLDTHAEQFFAPAEEGAFGLELKRYDAKKSDRMEGRGGWGAKVRHRSDQVFCKQVLYGVTRYAKLLDTFVEALYDKHKGKLHRREKDETKIISYLALLRMDELGFGATAAIINAHPSGAQFGVPFLEFLFDTSGLRSGSIYKQWRTVYDDAWVENVLGAIDLYQQDAELLLSKFKQEVEGFGGTAGDSATDADASDGSSSEIDSDGNPVRKESKRSGSRGKPKTKKRTTTVVAPFTLQPSRPRPQLPVDPAPAHFKANPAPISTSRFGPTADEIRVKRMTVKNKQRVTAKYSNPKLEFKLTAKERPSNLERVRAEMACAREQELEAVKKATVPIGQPIPVSNKPGYVGQQGVIRTTTAAIFRAAAVLQKHREKEVHSIANFEAGLRDSSAYDTWRAKVRAEDQGTRLAQIEATRFEVDRCNDGAHAAMDRTFLENAKKGIVARAAKASLKLEREGFETEKLSHAKQLKERVESDKRKADDAKERLRLERKRNAELRAVEKLKLAQQVADEKNRELERKADLVRRIKALAVENEESLLLGDFSLRDSKKQINTGERSSRDGVYNKTASPLLEDMSMAELRERLTLVAKRAEVKEKNRREQFRLAREKKAAFIADKLADVNRHNSSVSLTLKQKREQRTAEDAKRRDSVEKKREADERAMEVKQKAKQRETERLEKIKKAKSEADTFHASRRTANDPTAGSRKERSILVGQARTSQNEHVRVRKEIFNNEKTRKVESRRAKERRDLENREKSQFELEYEAKLRAAGKQDETMRRDQLREKQQAVERERARVEEMRSTFGKLNGGGNMHYGALKASVGPATLKRAGLTSDLTRGAFAGTARINTGKNEAAENALRHAYQHEFAGTRDTLLDAGLNTKGVARTAVE